MELYDRVCEKLDGSEEILTGDYCSKISMMTGEASENIYLLILHHFVLSNKGHEQSLKNGEYPYSAKSASKDGKGTIFRLSSLPEEIQKIIYRYLKLISV